MKQAFVLAIFLFVTGACTAQPTEPTPMPSATAVSTLSEAEAATLRSLELVDDYPLYTMRYTAPYANRRGMYADQKASTALHFPVHGTCHADWGCSLFAALGDDQDRVFGRNFDWQFSPALLLFTEPDDGYASVSMVDISYLGFTGDRSKHLKDLPLEEIKPLLQAPSFAFDGMNEMGLAVGMAAVPPGNAPRDPEKQTIDQLQVIREILDHAATLEEAIDILGSYNIDMGTVPVHYLIGSASGASAAVEFYEGQMVVFRNQSPWQAATNFLLASTAANPQGQCWRYDRMARRLAQLQGRTPAPDAMRLLQDVSQDNTQWSVIYHMTSGDIDIVMGRHYSEPMHRLHLIQQAQ